MSQKFDFRTATYFPAALYYGGILLMLGGVVFAFANLLAGVIFLFSGIIFLTTSYRFEIDLEQRTYREYVWFLGMKNGKAERFENIEYLFVKKSKRSQRMNSLITSRTLTKDTFDGYLKFSEHSKVHLSTKESKSDLMKRLREISGALRVRIVDYSE